MTCIVCLSSINDNSYHCADSKCKGKYCGECVVLLIEYSKDENIFPVCPTSGCNQILLQSNIPKSAIKIYRQLCLNVFIKEKGDVVNRELQTKFVLEKIKKERQAFIHQTYPEAISLVASIAFESKIKRLEKQKKQSIEEENQKLKRRCMNTTCNGYISFESLKEGNLQCEKCETFFCKQCEKRMTKGHACKQEDLDSVDLINNMKRCPECYYPVFKSQGCDSITCSVCSTNFNYVTGEKGGHGSHNIKIVVNMDQKQKLSITFGKKLSATALKMLLEIEAKEPKMMSKNILLSPIKSYYQDKDAEKASISLTKRLEKYYLNKLETRKYQTFMAELETLLNDKYNDVRVIYKLRSF